MTRMTTRREFLKASGKGACILFAAVMAPTGIARTLPSLDNKKIPPGSGSHDGAYTMMDGWLLRESDI